VPVFFIKKPSAVNAQQSAKTSLSNEGRGSLQFFPYRFLLKAEGRQLKAFFMT